MPDTANLGMNLWLERSQNLEKNLLLPVFQLPSKYLPLNPQISAGFTYFTSQRSFILQQT